MSRIEKLNIEKKYRKKKLLNGLKKYLLYPLLGIIIFAFLAIIIVFHSPYTYLKELYVTTAMTTMTHQYLARWFVSDQEIKQIMEKNKIDDSFANTEQSDINASQNSDKIELIDISGPKYKGYLMIVHDPSRVSVGTTANLGRRGMKLEEIVKRYNALAGINAGGFGDLNGRGTGGIPEGIIIENYQIMYKQNSKTYNLVGIDKDNVLVLGKYTLDEIQKLNIRDAVSFRPFLIINGEPTIKRGDGGWGLQPRTAIGQRKDGAILFLVIDGRQIHSIGATLKEVSDIMLQYGAYNATNLDGGSSSTLYYQDKIQNSPCSRYGPRSLPSAFIVK